MRKFFKNKVLYILSATAIIFSCLFMFLFKGPQAEAAKDTHTITLSDITSATLDSNYNTTNLTKLMPVKTVVQVG